MNDTQTSDAQLRAEIESLRRALEEQKAANRQTGHPRGTALLLLVVLLVALLAAGYYFGYLPRQRREAVLAAEASAGVAALPVVNVIAVKAAPAVAELLLPGNIQAVTEAPVLARTTGFLRKRNVDIGDRVQEGDVLAEIEAPELDKQIDQARAGLDQIGAAIEQAQASLEQGRANENLARITSGRWSLLAQQGVVSKQDNDNYQAQYAAQQANVKALDKAVAAQRSNLAAAQANLARLLEVKNYQLVRAPFSGVITLRNVDTGALIAEGNTLLFRIAQTGRLRTYVNVPQSDAAFVHAGQEATLTLTDLPGRKFAGRVGRTSSALDPSSRTLLTQVDVDNSSGALLPGMYAQVSLGVHRASPPLIIPGDALVVRADGPQVAVAGEGGTVHFTRVQLGRDYGDRIEVLTGLQPGQQIIMNPSDAVREGGKVKPVPRPGNE